MTTVGSLFTGAGLLDIGLHQAGFQHEWMCEADPWRRALLHKRFPGVPVHADVRAVGALTARRVDVIAGGFPCKGASTAGKRTGLDHPETALWREMRRCVGELRPRFVLLENVANLLAIHRGDVWGTVVGDLAALGYDTVWDCIPAAAFGAPHLRDRVFAIAADASCVGERAAHDAADAVAGGGDAREVPRGGGHELAADADGERRPESVGAVAGGSERAGAADRGAAPADPDGRRGWHEPVAVRGGGGPPAARDAHQAASHADRDARERELVGGPVRVPGRPDGAGHRSGPEAATDADQGRREGLPPGDLEEPAQRQSDAHGPRVEWGAYEPAIRRWEAVHGPAPDPLTGLRGLDDGNPAMHRLRRGMDRPRLSALGDGVHVYAARLIGAHLMTLVAA